MQMDTPACPQYYSGENCEEEPNRCYYRCRNGGTCFYSGRKKKCLCRPGFEGRRCQTNIDDCEGNPCLNGGTCCDGVNSFTCQCPTGFTGEHCEVIITSNCQCQNGGNCTSSLGDYEYDTACSSHRVVPLSWDRDRTTLDNTDIQTFSFGGPKGIAVQDTCEPVIAQWRNGIPLHQHCRVTNPSGLRIHFSNGSQISGDPSGFFFNRDGDGPRASITFLRVRTFTHVGIFVLHVYTL